MRAPPVLVLVSLFALGYSTPIDEYAACTLQSLEGTGRMPTEFFGG